MMFLPKETTFINRNTHILTVSIQCIVTNILDNCFGHGNIGLIELIIKPTFDGVEDKYSVHCTLIYHMNTSQTEQ
jgi:hypothetical protein